MFEKVNPSHPDKVADRIAGAIVDLAYSKVADPKIAVEVLIGHENCTIIIESSVSGKLSYHEITDIVHRIAQDEYMEVDVHQVPQDEHLANNQSEKLRCGDNGIFRGTPITNEERTLTYLAETLYDRFPSDGKFIIVDNPPTIQLSDSKVSPSFIICQSNATTEELEDEIIGYCEDAKVNLIINPLGDWTGGTDVDTGATNRKLGSDMGGAVTGGGLHGKDLSKADVSVNIYAHLRAQQLGRWVEFHCAIGDEYIDGLPYSAIVEVARDYIFNQCGGFEKFAEWGLLR